MKSVLISGSSSGIGEATALYLAERDWVVYAGVRNLQDAPNHQNIKPVQLDVTSPVSVKQCLEGIQRQTSNLDALINNAGKVVAGPWENLDLAQVEESYQVNVFGAMRLTQAALPLLKRAQEARIVNISSISGKVAWPLLGPYASSKFALEAFSDSLRRELYPRMKVVILEPGPIKTPIWKKPSLPEEFDARYTKMAEKLEKMSQDFYEKSPPPELVAQKVYKALTASKPPTRMVFPFDSWLGVMLGTLFPTKVVDEFIYRNSR